MKKNSLKFKKLSVILTSTLFMVMSSCTFAPNLREQLKLFTEEAEVIGTNIDEYEKYKKNGVYLIPSNISEDGFSLKIKIKNPQNFDFICSDIKKYFGEDADGITISHGNKEYNVITIKYSKKYLEDQELKYIKNKDDVYIQPGHLADPDYVLFTEKNNANLQNKKELKYSCDFLIESDSPPDPINKIKTFYTKTDSTDENSVSTSVVFFNMPVSSDRFDSNKNGDITTLKLTARNMETNTTIYTKTCALKTNTEADDGSSTSPYFTFDDKQFISAYEFEKDGTKPTDKLASYTDDDNANWDKYASVLFFSNDDSSHGQIIYEITLYDKKGQGSITSSAYTQEFPKLPSNISVYNNGVEINDKGSITQNENSYTASISFKLPEKIYYLGIEDEKGRVAGAKNTYHDTETDQSFKITVSADSYSINTESQKIKGNFEAWIKANNIKIIEEDMPSNAEIFYDIKDEQGISCTSGYAKPDEIITDIPPGKLTIKANIYCSAKSESPTSNFSIYMDGDTKSSTITVNANKLYVKAHDHKNNELDYGTDNKPYYSITAAANALTNKTDESNEIDVIGKLEENISLNLSGAAKDSEYKVKLNALKDTVGAGEDPYPIIKAKDTSSPVLTIGNNYVIEINNFTFNGDISIGNNSTVTFVDCVINGKTQIGENSKIAFSKGSSRNTLMGDIVCGTGSQLEIQNGEVTGNISSENNESVTITITGTSVTGNITTGENSLVTIQSYEESTNSSASGSMSFVEGNITTGKGTAKSYTLKILNSSVTGNITIDENSTALLDNAYVMVTKEDPEAENLGNVYVGKNYDGKNPVPSSVLELNNSVTIEGKVLLANPTLDSAGSAEDWNLIKLQMNYNPTSSQIKVLVENPTAYLPVIDFDSVYKGSKTYSEKIRADITASAYTYFISSLPGFNLYLPDSQSTTIQLKPSGVGIRIPITGGFVINGINTSYETGSTIKVSSITNEKINGNFTVESPKMKLFLMGQPVTESSSLSLELKYKNENIPAGKYQLVISFVYDGTTFSETRDITITE